MKLVIYGINYRPELVGVGKYTAEMAEWLARRGHQVTVITAPPHYPQWKIGTGYHGWRYLREQLAGVDVHRCPIWLPRRYSPLRRIFSVVSFALSSFVPLLRAAWLRPDWLIVIEPSFFCLPGAWIASRILGIRLWLHVQDFELSAADKLGLVRGRGLIRIAAAVERWFLRQPHRVSTLSHPMLQRLAAAGVPRERRVVFPNWVNIETTVPLPRPSTYRAELGISAATIVLLYSGSIGRKQGLDLVIAAAKKTVDRADMLYVICGEGAERERLSGLSATLRNVRWLPLQPRERLNELLNLADVHLLPQRTGIADAVLPSKLTGMLASGRPVVATTEPGTPLAEVVTQSGIVVPPADVAALVQALKSLADDPVRRAFLGAEARRYADAKLSEDAILWHFERKLRSR